MILCESARRDFISVTTILSSRSTIQEQGNLPITLTVMFAEIGGSELVSSHDTQKYCPEFSAVALPCERVNESGVASVVFVRSLDACVAHSDEGVAVLVTHSWSMVELHHQR